MFTDFKRSFAYLQSSDRGSREHILVVHIPQKVSDDGCLLSVPPSHFNVFQYPVASPTCVADLPIAFEPHWGSQVHKCY